MLTVTVSRKNGISVLYGLLVSTPGVRQHGLSYSQFIGKLHNSGIELNRKVLADLAMNHPDAFKAVVDHVK
ncbi:ribosomal protein L20 [Siphonobacter sp. BAB-5404]|nr:ribosomal protein L20 [Siphonobacter sp. SORGH_AS_0500]